MPPNFQRFLPFVLIAAVLLFIVPQLLKKHTSGPSASTRATQTIDAMNLIDKGEQSYKTAHGRFTPHLADLLPLNTRLAGDLAIHLGVQLDVSTDGQRFLAQVASDVLSLVRARTDNKITAQSCLILKSGSGVKCPAPISNVNSKQKSILIAIDGSPAAHAAVAAGLEVALAMQASVSFVHASPLARKLFDLYPMDGPPIDKILERDDVLRDAMEQAKQQSVDAEPRLIAREGSSADLAADLAGMATGLEASMIVVGSRGRGLVAGEVLGSVSHNLIKWATVPILIVHAPGNVASD